PNAVFPSPTASASAHSFACGRTLRLFARPAFRWHLHAAAGIFDFVAFCGTLHFLSGLMLTTRFIGTEKCEADGAPLVRTERNFPGVRKTVAPPLEISPPTVKVGAS